MGQMVTEIRVDRPVASSLRRSAWEEAIVAWMVAAMEEWQGREYMEACRVIWEASG